MQVICFGGTVAFGGYDSKCTYASALLSASEVAAS